MHLHSDNTTVRQYFVVAMQNSESSLLSMHCACEQLLHSSLSWLIGMCACARVLCTSWTRPTSCDHKSSFTRAAVHRTIIRCDLEQRFYILM